MNNVKCFRHILKFRCYIFLFFLNHLLSLHTLTCIVTGNITQCPGCWLFDPWIKLLQTDDESIKRSAVHNRLCQLGGVLGYSTQDKCCCLLVKPLLTSGLKISITTLNTKLTWGQDFDLVIQSNAFCVCVANMQMANFSSTLAVCAYMGYCLNHHTSPLQLVIRTFIFWFLRWSANYNF